MGGRSSAARPQETSGVTRPVLLHVGLACCGGSSPRHAKSCGVSSCRGWMIEVGRGQRTACDMCGGGGRQGGCSLAWTCTDLREADVCQPHALILCQGVSRVGQSRCTDVCARTAVKASVWPRRWYGIRKATSSEHRHRRVFGGAPTAVRSSARLPRSGAAARQVTGDRGRIAPARALRLGQRPSGCASRRPREPWL